MQQKVLDGHHVLSSPTGWNVEDAVLADIALSGLPADLQGAGGGVTDLKVLDSAQSLCREQQEHL